MSCHFSDVIMICIRLWHDDAFSLEDSALCFYLIYCQSNICWTILDVNHGQQPKNLRKIFANWEQHCYESGNGSPNLPCRGLFHQCGSIVWRVCLIWVNLHATNFWFLLIVPKFYCTLKLLRTPLVVTDFIFTLLLRQWGLLIILYWYKLKTANIGMGQLHAWSLIDGCIRLLVASKL